MAEVGIISVRKMMVHVPKTLYEDLETAGNRARMFAHLHSMATPVVADTKKVKDGHLIVLQELGSAAVAESAKRSRT